MEETDAEGKLTTNAHQWILDANETESKANQELFEQMVRDDPFGEDNYGDLYDVKRRSLFDINY